MNTIVGTRSNNTRRDKLDVGRKMLTLAKRILRGMDQEFLFVKKIEEIARSISDLDPNQINFKTTTRFKEIDKELEQLTMLADETKRAWSRSRQSGLFKKLSKEGIKAK